MNSSSWLAGDPLVEYEKEHQNLIDPRAIRSTLDMRSNLSVKPLTRPKEFSFATAHRSRPSRFLSREEQLELELDNREKTQFRAQPRPIHEPPEAPVVAKRPVTEPESPMFHTTARLGKKRRADEIATGPDVQDSQETNKKRRSTRRRTLQLITELRGQQSREALERAIEEQRREEEGRRAFRARPLPASTFQPNVKIILEQKATRPAPFKLNTDSRGNLKREELSRKLQEEERRERDLREFRARPLPCKEPFVAQPSSIPLTDPVPFPLRTEERGSKKVDDLELKLREEANQDKENRCFRAKPLPRAEPFRPRPSDRPLTEVQVFNLSSDIRSQERAAFDAQIKAKEAAEAEAKRKAQEERERQEQKEIRRLRRQLVHKARPIPLAVYQPMRVQPANKVLTEPESPLLHTKLRRSHNSSTRST